MMGQAPRVADSSVSARADRIWLLAILTLAAVFRLYEIGFPDIWVDEANLILTAEQPLAELFGRLRADSSPPLYYLAIHVWSALFGDSAVALRMLSVISGVVLVGATWWAARDLVSSQAGLWAAFYLAVNPSQSFFSQQVRMYVWIGLFALLSLVGLVRYLRDGRRRDFALWVGASIAALYNHNFAVHVGIAHAILIAVSGQLFSRVRMWLLAAALVAVAYAPWVPTLLIQLGNEDHYAWYQPLWDHHGVLGTIAVSLRSFSPSLEYLNYGWIGSFKTLWGIPTLAASALASLGIWLSIRRIPRLGAAAALWPVIGLAAPAVSALTLSLWLTPHYVPGRVDQMMLPEFALLIGMAIAWLRPAGLRAAVGVAILALAVVAKYEMYDIYRDPEVAGGDRAAAVAIMERSQPRDVIVTTSLSRASLVYYFQRHAHDAAIVSFPRAAAQHLGAQNDARLLRDKGALMRETAATLDEATALAGPDGQVFIVWVRANVNYPLRHEALSEYGYTEVDFLGKFRQFGTGSIMEVRQYRPDSRPGL
jgi:4-amino-4-deoxy-L-arabinose transferase-like glycosyltransferase